MPVASLARGEVEARAAESGGGGAYLRGTAGPVSAVGGGATALLAASQRAPRATSASVFGELSAGGATPAAELYADYFDGLPAMHDATKEVLARSHAVANPRRMGYADARPDIAPTSRFGAHADHAGERVGFDATGAGGRAAGAFAASLRPALYTPSKHEAPARGGREWARAWASPAGGGGGAGGAGGGLAPSEAAAGYAYRHAAAVSQWAGAGSVYDRLTDPRGYTGLSRHRFDADGRGRGMRGRDGGGTDMAWLDASFPRDSQRGAWYLADAQASGFGRAAGMGRRAHDGSV